MDQCTIGAVPLRGGTNAHGAAGAQMVRRRQEHQSAWKGAKRSSKAAEPPNHYSAGGKAAGAFLSLLGRSCRVLELAMTEHDGGRAPESPHRPRRKRL